MASGTMVLPLAGLESRLEPADWAFSSEHRTEIEANWRRVTAAKPSIYNGRVLLQHRWTLSAGVYSGFYLETDYASFLAWRDFGHPGRPMRNGFSLAALRAADGAFLLGIMGQHTANPGRIYFAAGTPDPSDLTADGTIDLAGSAVRELCEETGLRPEEFEVEERWDLVLDHVRAAFMRPVRLKMKAAEALDVITARLAAQAEPELAGMHVVRSRADLDAARMPGFMLAYLDAVL